LRVPEVEYHIVKKLIRRIETEGRGIADVELYNLESLLLQPFGLLQDRTTNVIADIGELLRLVELGKGGQLFLPEAPVQGALDELGDNENMEFAPVSIEETLDFHPTVALSKRFAPLLNEVPNLLIVLAKGVE
jgi:hypothetical protein